MSEENSKKRLIDLWEELDEHHPNNSHLRGDATFAGPVANRKCTDLAFLIVFIVLNLGLVYSSYSVINAGAPVRLSRGYDFRGEVCGQGGLGSIPYMYWPDPSNTLDFSLCVKECPKFYLEDYFCVYDNDHVSLYLDWCWNTVQSTTYGFYCIPIFEQERRKVIDYLFSTIQLFKRSIGDFTLAWDTMVVGVLVSVIVSFIFLIFFRFRYSSIGLMTLSIVANQVLLLYLTYLIYQSYQSTYNLLCVGDAAIPPEYCYTAPSDGLLYCIFAFGFLTLLYPIIILLKVKAIKLSIGIIKLATQPFHLLKQIFFYPLMQLVLASLIIGFLMMVIIYTMSTGVIPVVYSDSIPGGRAKVIEYTSNEKYFLIYNIVMTIWWISFIFAFSEFVLSAAVSVWYFTRERSSLYFPLWRGFKLVAKYHMGSVVRGSLFTTFSLIPQFIFKNYKSLASICRRKAPGCTDCMLNCCYCINCYQKRLRYYSKYSYIFLALFGENYSVAAQKSFYLINRNRDRIFVPAKAGDFGMFIIKLTITLSGTVISFTILLLSITTPTGQVTQQLVAPIFVAFVASLCCALVSEVFGGSMQACMNTIVICAACDEEMFTREQRFMYKELQEYLDAIYEEMTEQQREHKQMVKMKHSDKIYKKNKVVDERESTSVMKAYFDHKTEVSAPVQAMKIEDIEEEEGDVFVMPQPKIKVLNASYNESLRPAAFNSSFQNHLGVPNSSFRGDVSGLEQRSGLAPPLPNNSMNIFENKSRNQLYPNDVVADMSLLSAGQSAIEGRGLNHSFLSQNRSFGDNRSRIDRELDSRNNSRDEIRINSSGFFNDKSDDAIKVDNEGSFEVDGSNLPRFR